ncbi:hypothetical protein SERLADRAFT_376402 [Serpula lacrymans var. lacrymans S7.9]|uniref:Uncharacterized protein n=1 Tax=Serpula lacrymans var. lacrymans (strain S7.9) TaxID=578457 RepID=F8NG13_SERL9|nr:uncharacterized protein SERLADRAFT_376402 [Serpula lacrymans var. lacrymans S7.9]EGO30983.1 hypothetical protein SERLADRAFT_376402 [Serpula lacrymans var. lacrymans S7.9]
MSWFSNAFPITPLALGLEVSFAILLLIALTGFLNHRYHFISQIRDWVSLPPSQHTDSLLTTTCDPVWSQHFPLLPLLTGVIVTRHFLKVIVIPFD